MAMFAIAMVSSLLSPAGTPAADDGGSGLCIEQALRPPQVTEAEMIHPGDHYSQAIYAEFRLRAFASAVCFQRIETPRPEYQFQLQEPLDHARWIGLDAFTTAGVSRLHNVPSLDARWFREGRKAPGGLKIPIHRRKLYACSPGPGITHIRMILRLEAADSVTGRHATREVTVPVEVKTVRAPLKHRGALRGAC